MNKIEKFSVFVKVWEMLLVSLELKVQNLNIFVQKRQKIISSVIH